MLLHVVRYHGSWTPVGRSTVVKFSMLVVPAGGGFKVREQRDEHQAIQLFATPVLVAQFHGRFHMVATVCR